MLAEQLWEELFDLLLLTMVICCVLCVLSAPSLSLLYGKLQGEFIR